jgi:lipoyl(octanoyl) transferase
MPDDSAHAANVGIVRRLGLTEYEPTWRAMQGFTLSRDALTEDEIWLTEHPPVYTLGLAGRMQHVHRSNGIPVVKVDRGGQVTYHGPGQLVAYVLVDLRRRGLGVRRMVRGIETAVIDWLHALGVNAYARDSAPGVYVQGDGKEAKIAALGLRVKNGCTYHGVSLNLAMDLTPFDNIDPCGYAGMAVTQVAAFTRAPSVTAAGDTLAPLLFRHITAAQS